MSHLMLASFFILFYFSVLQHQRTQSFLYLSYFGFKLMIRPKPKQVFVVPLVNRVIALTLNIINQVINTWTMQHVLVQLLC